MKAHIGLLALLLTVGLRVASAAPLTVYDDQLRNGFADWSWAAHALSQTAVVHTGTAAASFEPDAWQALFLHRDLGIDTAAWSALDFWIHGGPAGGQNLTVALTMGGSPIGNQGAALAPFIIGGGAVPAGQWGKVHIPFASLGVSSGTFDGFWLQDGTGGNQSAVYVDDVQLIENTTTTPPTPVAVAIDPAADRHAISPLIYGVNFGSAAQAARIHWPVRRWGGNATTRYSWQDDISNRASDWFFYNIEENNPNPGTLPNGSAADVFIDDVRSSGGEPLMTVPTIGWTPKDRIRRWGFSVAKYGAQQQTECTATGNPTWCQADAGNGLHTNGTPITGNDPHDTSKEIGPDFVTGWLAHIAGRTGTAGQPGGVKYFALDNEPALWNSSHRDVHPAPLTYDELWQRTMAYAAAMKAQDPNVRILGPSDWGWCAYFFSAADGCTAGADAAAHGNLALYDWYLKQVKDYQTAHGVQLIDYLDFHYYPQANNVSLSDDESAATSALRLRSLKGLYDPTYVDESWIGQAVDLIPRAKQWIANRFPGMKLAITEYNWGNDNGPSSTLAHAEALAIFGREGVDLAARWVAPADNSRVEDAYLLYLNYDGLGGKVSGDSVRAVSANINAVGAYAVRGAGSRLFVLLFNKDTVDREADVQFPAGTAAGTPAALYRFDPTHRLAAAGTANLAGDALILILPPRSATLAVLDAQAPAATDFYTLAPCRLLDTRNATGPLGGPALDAGATRTFNLAGHCGVPATAKAVSVNVTVVAPMAAGYLIAWPGGGTAPVASLLNFASGQTRSNNAIVPLSQDGNGTLALRANLPSGSAQVVVDVNGYFQ